MNDNDRDETKGGEGWYEFFAPVGTTHIAYVHANGEIYLPEEGWTDLTHNDWLAASVKGQVHKLVRAAIGGVE